MKKKTTNKTAKPDPQAAILEQVQLESQAAINELTRQRNIAQAELVQAKVESAKLSKRVSSLMNEMEKLKAAKA